MKSTIGFILLLCNLNLVGQGFEKINLGSGRANIVKFSPNNNVIAFAFGKKVKFIRSGIQIGEIKTEGGRIEAISFDHSGENILIVHHNGWVNTWNVKTRQKVFEYKTDYGLIGGHFVESPLGILTVSHKRLAIHSTEGEVLVKHENSGALLTAMAISRNGIYVAIGSNSGIVTILDDKGELQNEFKTGLKHIHRLALTPNGKKLAVSSHGGNVDLWDIVSGEWIKTLLSTSGRINSLEFSNDAEYLAAGGESFSILSVTEENPNIIYNKLTGGVITSSFSLDGTKVCVVEDLNPQARLYDISDLQIPPFFKFRDESDTMSPLVYISNPPKIINDRLNYSKPYIDIQGSIFDDFGVKDLFINGIRTPVKENGNFIIHLPLVEGENQVTLQGTDINGNGSIRKFTINRRGESQDYDYKVARNYLFAVGIDDYQKWPKLNNAVKDANDIAAVLMQKYQFEFSDITILKNEQASQSNIYSGLRSLIEKVTPQDNLIIYFSGHGHFDELLNEGYWIPVNANSNASGEYLANTSILKILENINSHHTLLIADACFAGSLFTESLRGNAYIERVDRLQSRWGLASGRLEAVSDGEIGLNSPFARALLSFLQNNTEFEVAVSEVIQYVKMRVAEEEGQTPIGNPLRLSGDEGGEFIFRQKKPRDSG